MKKNVEKMNTYLSGYFEGAGMIDALRALTFASERHSGQFRDDGTPYIIHPLRMACHATDICIKDENIMVAILLHDVVEDCGVPLEGLPFNDKVKEIVRYVTIEYVANEEKKKAKDRYFKNMIYQPEALIVKGLDRYDNMSTMAELGRDRIEKNVNENETFLLPLLKEAKHRYPDKRRAFYILRDGICNFDVVYKSILGF